MNQHSSVTRHIRAAGLSVKMDEEATASALSCNERIEKFASKNQEKSKSFTSK